MLATPYFLVLRYRRMESTGPRKHHVPQQVCIASWNPRREACEPIHPSAPANVALANSDSATRLVLAHWQLVCPSGQTVRQPSRCDLLASFRRYARHIIIGAVVGLVSRWWAAIETAAPRANVETTWPYQPCRSREKSMVVHTHSARPRVSQDVSAPLFTPVFLRFERRAFRPKPLSASTVYFGGNDENHHDPRRRRGRVPLCPRQQPRIPAPRR